MGEGRGRKMPVNEAFRCHGANLLPSAKFIGMGTMSQWSAGEIHLPQLLNEEANADEFSNWEQVSSTAAERFVPWPPASPALSSPLPSP